MKKLGNILYVAGALLILSGCGGIFDWTKETFLKGDSHKITLEETRAYIKSGTIYNQLTTIAIFDALWLSDDVKTFYAACDAAMYGKSVALQSRLLERELALNKTSLTFYVLSLNTINLIGNSLWNVYLKIGDCTYQSIETKIVELPAAYQYLFGKVLTRHKKVYQVSFDRFDENKKDILNTEEPMHLYISSPSYYLALSWAL